MNHVHMTIYSVADLGDGCAQGARGTYAASDPTDTPASTPILLHAS